MSTLPEAPKFGPEADLELEPGTPVSPGGSYSAHPGLSVDKERELTSSDGEMEPRDDSPRENTGYAVR